MLENWFEVSTKNIGNGVGESKQVKVLNRVTSATEDWWTCLLHTSDAADELLCVDLGGRRLVNRKLISNHPCLIEDRYYYLQYRNIRLHQIRDY